MHRAGSRLASEPAAAPTSRLLRRRLRRVRFSAILAGASAACAEVWMSVTPCAFKVAAVATMMNRLITFE
jgi:hypothetical protein